jgi:hypothetical protein
LRSAYQELINAQRDFETVAYGEAQPSLEASQRGIAGVAEAILSGGPGSLTMPDIRWCETFDSPRKTLSNRRNN